MSVCLTLQQDTEQMPAYYAYLIGLDGHISRRVDLNCADDEAAKVAACQLAEGHDVELWLLDRLVARFAHKA